MTPERRFGETEGGRGNGASTPEVAVGGLGGGSFGPGTRADEADGAIDAGIGQASCRQA